MIYNDICITFDLFQNLLTVTVYLECVTNFDLSILGYVNVKVLWIECRFAVAEGELRKPTVAEDRSVLVAVSGVKVCFMIINRIITVH